ncbi:MAG: hypothetical protein JXJ04_08575 [Spirochaetales bacterium]|nr:hypothetical protein [Spirochaetales bacterium]
MVLKAETTGLQKDSVANVSQIVTIDKKILTKRVKKIPGKEIVLRFFHFTILH